MKELIDELSYDLAECHVDYLDDAKLYTDYDTMAQKLISRGYRRVVDANSATPTSGWISVELQEEPNENGTYLCYGYWIGSRRNVTKTADYLGKWKVVDNFAITHWMPLPEAPKGGAE